MKENKSIYLYTILGRKNNINKLAPVINGLISKTCRIHAVFTNNLLTTINIEKNGGLIDWGGWVLYLQSCYTLYPWRKIFCKYFSLWVI